MGQAGDECGDAPAGDGRAVQTQLLELLEAPQGGQAGVRQPRVAQRQLLQTAGRDSGRLHGRWGNCRCSNIGKNCFIRGPI